MKKVILSLIAGFFGITAINAQTFTSGAFTLVDYGNKVCALQVNGLNPANINGMFGLESVTLNLTHPADNTLTISLVSPNGVTLTTLYSGNGMGGGANFINTVFTETAPTSITAGTPPFTGSFKAAQSLTAVNNGQAGNGIWNLYVYDGSSDGLVGNISSWSLTFGNNPAAAISSSNLPIVIITGPTNDTHSARMGIISNPNGQRNHITDPFNAYNNKISYFPRGQSSLTFEQQQYKVETFNSAGVELDTVLLGMPAEHEWVLYDPYNDKTLLRNVLMYGLARGEGEWAPRTQFCEVIINGDYKGVYVLLEYIKRDGKRVNVSKLDLDDNVGDSLTGGYIFKTDWDGGVDDFQTAHGLSFGIHYPKAITPTQSNYLHQYIDSLENALYGPNFADPVNGYSKYMDVGSFIDFMIWAEVAYNQDTYHASTYYHKEKITKDHGQIKAGPIWDFNFGFGISPWYGDVYQGWIYQQGMNWQTQMSLDTNFQNKVKCRWLWLRSKSLNLVNVNHYIDSMVVVLNESMLRHFNRYPIMGVPCCYNNLGASPLPQDYAGEIAYLKNWMQNRIAFLDANWYGKCYSVGIDNQPIAEEALFYAYPNPFSDMITLNYFLNESAALTLEMYDQQGRLVSRMDLGRVEQGDHTEQLSGYDALPAGIYLLKLNGSQKAYCKTIVKQ
jgi:subtilisin-like proprotein convertase family protein